MKAARFVELLCRYVLAAVFLGACLPKILHPHDFALAVFRYQLAPYGAVNLIAITLPWIELTAALALLIARPWREAAALALFGLLLAFTLAIGINLARGIDIACGCFSVDEEVGRIGWLSIARNVALMAMAGVVFWRHRRTV